MQLGYQGILFTVINLHTPIVLEHQLACFRSGDCMQPMLSTLSVAPLACISKQCQPNYYHANTYVVCAAPQAPPLAAIQQLLHPARTKSVDKPQQPDPRRSLLAFIAADNAGEETSEDEEAAAQEEDLAAVAAAPAEAVDWDALLARPPAAGEAQGGSHSTHMSVKVSAIIPPTKLKGLQV